MHCALRPRFWSADVRKQQTLDYLEDFEFRNTNAAVVGATKFKLTLSSLPLEVLQHIAFCVEQTHQPSLQAFSLTNKACYEASLCVIFQRITIVVHDREGLRRDVYVLIRALSRTDSFRYIQQITIKGALRLKAERTAGSATPRVVSTSLDQILDEEPVSWGGWYTVHDESIIERSSEEDMAWAPVVDLLRAEIPLKDLVYDCRSQLPPSLFGILRDQHPQCRLHHLSFKFRTLSWDVPHPYEMELATSPCLYRVKVICAQRDSDGNDDFNVEATMELAYGLAPNLQEVIILQLNPALSLRSARPRGSWHGLPGFTRGARGSLKSLSLKGFVSLMKTPAMLQDWTRHVDFASLQQLVLGGCSDENKFGLSGETMHWIAESQVFPQVKTLRVYLERDDLFVVRSHYSENAISFFRTFHALEELSIDGPIDIKIMDSILTHHGQMLRKLSLRPFEGTPFYVGTRDRLDIPFEFTTDRILQIENQCPFLEELAIPVKRNKSNASEAEIYKCFGRMKMLRSLFLMLDCSNWRVARDPTYDPDFDEEDRKPLKWTQQGPGGQHFAVKRGELKETLINCAVDKDLACSIWNVISQNKTGRQLERLKLWPTGEGEYGAGASPAGLTVFQAITLNLARSWLFERNPLDDKGVFTVTEMRKERRKNCEQRDATNDLTFSQQSDIWEVFRSIWPSQNGSEDWRDDWSSHPLQ